MRSAAWIMCDADTCTQRIQSIGPPHNSSGSWRNYLCEFLLLFGVMWISGCKATPAVLVGPVDPRFGIAGIAAKGMTRSEVIGVLGQPLIARETMMEAARRYDSDAIVTDYFSGIYADAHWDNNDSLAALTFDFDKFAKRFWKELKVEMAINRHRVVLSRALTLDRAKSSWFVKQLGLRTSQISKYRNDIVIHVAGVDSAVILHFSHKDNRLQNVYVRWFGI